LSSPQARSTISRSPAPLYQHRAIVAAVGRRDAAEAEAEALIARHFEETLGLLRRASAVRPVQSISS